MLTALLVSLTSAVLVFDAQTLDEFRFWVSARPRCPFVYLDLTDQFAGALGFASALSTPYLLDNEFDALAAAVDGDPATAVEQPT